MFEPLRDPRFRQLFAAQLVSLLGTGLLTVGLGLTAFDMAGANAGAVLGWALTLKMVAYVGLAPFAAALAERLPRRGFLIALNLFRGGVAACLPWVTEIWQIYVLIFLLQAASAAYTPAFQALLPALLPDEQVYTRALALSRLAYDLESVGSPLFAALLLLAMPASGLFGGTAIGFLLAALLVSRVLLPPLGASGSGPFLERAARGVRIFRATPRLRALMGLNLVVAAGGAMVLVNTVVIVEHRLGLTEGAVALALAAYGLGSMLSALTLPRVLDRVGDRAVTLVAGAVLSLCAAVLVLFLSAGGPEWAALILLWCMLGLAGGAVMLPSGRILARSAAPPDRPAIFAAQFSLSHACWLVAYPLAGWGGAALGLAPAAMILAVLGAIGLAAAVFLWPKGDPPGRMILVNDKVMGMPPPVADMRVVG
ncbi:MAG: MFS transporter, partial [Pseudomonadota bacterium]